MKLVTKLTAALTLGSVVIFSVYGYFSVLWERALLMDEVRRDARALGLLLRGPMTAVWREHGKEKALEFLGSCNPDRASMQVRWVALSEENNPRPRASVSEPQQLLLREGEPVYVEEGKGARPDTLYAYVPLGCGNERGALEIVESLQSLEEHVRGLVRRKILLTFIMGLLSGLVALLSGEWMVGRPIRNLIAGIRRIGEGRLDPKVGPQGHDEVAALTREFNAMAGKLEVAAERLEQESSERLRAIDQLRHTERLATVGQLASGLAHELGTPLNVISGRVLLIEESAPADEETLVCTKVIKDQALRMTGIIRQLLEFARRRPPQMEQVNLIKLAERVASVLEPLAQKVHATLAIRSPDAPEVVMVDSIQIQQVLTNLIVNAIDAVGEHGEIEISVSPQRMRPLDTPGRAETDFACVSVRDNGMGIAEENLARIFDPFFTTKDIGKGTGLGLSVSYGIVKEHKGWIEVESTLGKGSCFRVFLPVKGEA